MQDKAESTQSTKLNLKSEAVFSLIKPCKPESGVSNALGMPLAHQEGGIGHNLDRRKIPFRWLLQPSVHQQRIEYVQAMLHAPFIARIIGEAGQ